MKCSCGGDTRVVDSRVQGISLRRRRLCMDCGNRFSTLETEIKVAERKPRVPKKEAPFVAPEVAAKIKKKQMEARRKIEDRRYAKEDADIFEDLLDEDIQWTSNL